MFKKLFFLLGSIFTLINCATTPSATIIILPKITLPRQDPSLMGITISINSTDQRQSQDLGLITRNSRLVTLMPSCDIGFFLQEVLEKQMIARGYMIGSDGQINLQIIINNLHADISQGNMRYNIATKADIAIFATAKNGNKIIKNYHISYSVKGILQPSNTNISNSVNNLLSNIITSMAHDTCIHNFIKQNSHKY